MKTNKLLFLFFIAICYNSFSQHSVTVKKGNTTFTIQGDTTKLRFKATIADYEDRLDDAANYLLKAIEKDEFEPDKVNRGYYDIACYFSLTKKSDKAIKYLVLSVENGWKDLGHLEYDSDLQELKKTKEWETIIEPHLTNYYKYNNRILAKIYSEDQAVRLSGQMDNNTAIQDSIRRESVLKMHRNNEMKSGDDYYKAGMIMHHGNATKDYIKAHEFSKKALEKENPNRMAPWFFAASKDRLLLSQDKPQWFGTQNMTFANGKIAMDPRILDTTAVTPKRRKELNAPSIETLREYLENFKSN